MQHVTAAEIMTPLTLPNRLILQKVPLLLQNGHDTLMYKAEWPHRLRDESAVSSMLVHERFSSTLLFSSKHLNHVQPLASLLGGLLIALN